MKKIIIYLLILVAFSNCEKDDICAADTPTTPQVVLEFFDNDSQLAKNVTNLNVQEIGSAKALATFNNVSKIKLPLKATTDLTKYKLILNFGNTTNPAIINEDNLQFDYARNNVYVSRACGFKTLFTLALNSPTKTDKAVPVDFWIKSIVVATPNILNENETHVKIYF